MGACGRLEEAVMRERDTPQCASWESLSREELRLQANLRPVGYAEWQCVVYKEAYAAACERNRLRVECDVEGGERVGEGVRELHVTPVRRGGGGGSLAGRTE